jgi:hypothetical protein
MLICFSQIYNGNKVREEFSEESKKPDYGDTELDKEHKEKEMEELRTNQDF